MKLTIYQIDAFAKNPFEGNPAAVIPLKNWLNDKVMQAIAMENNLSETAFYVPTDKGFHIRWFTPNTEVKLCGHATLATAFVIFYILGYVSDSITFESLSGPLYVSHKANLLSLDFPAQKPAHCNIPKNIIQGLGKKPVQCFKNEDYIAVFEKEEDVSSIIPDHNFLKNLDLRGVIATAPGTEHDFVVRFFAPKYGIPEDPVTGSAYTQLMPYWSEVLKKNLLTARQISKRGGEILCETRNNRIIISGTAVKFLEGIIEV